jgi:hypothetical protein
MTFVQSKHPWPPLECGGLTPLCRSPGSTGTEEVRSATNEPKPIAHVQSKAGNPRFNGKAERLWRTIKLWQRVTLFFTALLDIQSKVELFRGWYNAERVHQGLGGRTPDEAWNDTPRPDPVRYLAQDKMQPVFEVVREHHGDDSHLPVFKIRLRQFVKRIA